MAISFVGSYALTAAGATVGTTRTRLFSILRDAANVQPTLLQDDLVILCFAAGTAADRTLDVNAASTGWTKLSPELYANGTSNDANMAIFWKFMGASPDTQVIFNGAGSIQDGTVDLCHVFRGVDTTTPFDVTPTNTSGTGTGRPNPASITPVTVGALVMAYGCGAAALGFDFTNPGGYSSTTNHFLTTTSPDTVDGMAFGGIVDPNWTSGAVDPPQVTGGTTNAADSWVAYTLALRPAITLTHYTMPVTPGSYGLTGTAVTLAKGLSMPVTPGSYGLTGTATGFLRTYSMPVTPGSYTLTGTAVGFAVESTSGRNVVSLLGTPDFTTTAGAKAVTATPAVEDLIILVIAATSTTGSQTMTGISDTQGGTYSLVQSAVKNSNLDNVRVYVRDSLIPAAVSTTFNVTIGGDTGGGLAVLKAIGMGRYSGAAIRRTARQDNQVSGAPAPSYIGSPNPKDATIGVVLNDLNPASLTPPAGMTELVDTGYATPTTGLHIVKRDGGLTGSTVSWNESGFGFASIILDLNSDAGLMVTPGVYTLTGTAANLLFGHVPALTPGSYSLTGTAVTLTYAPASGYTLNPDIGAYNLTGTAAGFLFGRSMPVLGTWSYFVSGTDVTFSRTYIMPAAPGSYALTGTTTGLILGRSVGATPGSYTLTGTATGFLRTYVVPVTPGSYVLTGTAVNFLKGVTLTVDPGSYALTGTVVAFRESAITMDMVPGVYTLTGTAITFPAGKVISLDPGVYTTSGTAVAFLRGTSMTAVPGSYTLTGTAIGFLRTVVMPVTPGSYALTGTVTSFLRSRSMEAELGFYDYAGSPVTLIDSGAGMVGGASVKVSTFFYRR